jgi:dTDP-D-glucose 4,6-dehydratase
MKHARRLKLRHKIFLESQGLNWKDWLVVKDTTFSMEFISRSGEKKRFLK